MDNGGKPECENGLFVVVYDPLEDLVERTDFFGYPVALDSQITDTPFQTFFKTYCVSVTSSPIKVAADLEGIFLACFIWHNV